MNHLTLTQFSNSVGIGTPTPNEVLTVVGNISSTNIIYANGGNSVLWNLGYTSTAANSGKWETTYSTVFTLSSGWQSVYTTVLTNSGKWETAYYTLSTKENLSNKVNSISGSNINHTFYPTTSAVYDFVNESVIHAGAVSQPTYIDNGDGSITLSDGYYSFASDTVGSPPYKTFFLPGQVVNLVDQQLNYVLVNYNNGAPFITSSISNATVDNSIIYPIFAIARYETELRSISLKQEALGLPNKTILRIERTHLIEPEDGGLLIGTDANRAVTVTGGKVWFGSSYNTYSATNSQGGTEMRFWRHNGPGVWIYNVDSQFNNEAWDNGSFLVELTNKRFAVTYVWRSLGEGVDVLHFIVGRGDYKLGEAQEAPIPSDIPSLLQ